MSGPAMPRQVVTAAGLTRVFTDFWGRPKVTAVDQLDLEIRRGEVFGLLGPNGSGKSTTVKMLLGLLRPTSGRLEVLGRPPTDVATKASLGYLPEETRLYPFLNAEETLGFFGRLCDLSPAERKRRIPELLTTVGLLDSRRRRVGEYSKGMARRLGLAQALLNAPDFLILDEPTAGLDPLGMTEFKALIRALAATGRTVLLCSHLLAEVEDICDRVAVLHAGRKLAEGPVSEILGSDEAEGAQSRRLEDWFIEVVSKAREDIPRLELPAFLTGTARG